MTVHNGLQIDDVTGALLVTGGGQELGYAEITSNFAANGSANVQQDVPGLSAAVVVGSRPIVVEAFLPQFLHSVATTQLSLWIVEGATILQAATAFVAATNQGDPLFAKVRLAPTPGAHTYKVQIRSGTAGTWTVVAGVGYPASLQVREV